MSLRKNISVCLFITTATAGCLVPLKENRDAWNAPGTRTKGASYAREPAPSEPRSGLADLANAEDRSEIEKRGSAPVAISESTPRFSPDGASIAFVANFDREA